MRKFSKECTAFVDKYSDRIVEMVSRQLEPKQICRDLIFCVAESDRDSQDYDVGLEIVMRSLSNSAQLDTSAETTADLDGVESNPTCIICEFIMTKIEEELNDKQRDEDIKKVVKNICSKLPQTIGKECSTFIDYYFDMIIALIETTKPAEMCNLLKLCPQNKELLEIQYMEIKTDIYSCAVCRGVVESIDTIIEDPQIDTNLENLEEKICEKFARKFKDKCHNLASTYGLVIINLLKNVTESDQICYKLALCPMSENDHTGMIRFI